MRRYLLLLFAALAVVVSAQEKKKSSKKNGTVTGVVYSKSENTPLQNATLQLYLLPDTIYKVGAASNEKGEFSLQAPAGDYLLRLSYIGFMPQDKNIKLVAKKSVDIGRLELNDDVVALKEAVVTAEAPPITMAEDTAIYNTSAFRVAPCSMLEELIKKYP